MVRASKRSGLVGAGVVAALTVATPPAIGAPPWTAPTLIAGPAAPLLAPTWIRQSATIPHVSAGSGGWQLATWPENAPVRGRGTQVIAAIGPDRAVRTRTSTTIVDSAGYARDRVLHLVADAQGRKVQLGYRLGSANLRTLGRTTAIGAPRAISDVPVMSVNASGAAVIAWHHLTGRRDEIQLVIRPAGGRFGGVQTVKTTRVDGRAPVAVGIDAAGRAVVAYVLEDPAQIAARVIDTTNGRISSASSITPSGLADAAAPVQLAVGASSTARRAPMVVAWDAYRASEDASPISVGAATIAAAATRMTRATLLDPGSSAGYPRGPVVATVDAAGHPIVAWNALPTIAPGGTLDQTATPTIPMVAQADRAGSFGTPQQLDAAGTIGSVTAAGDGVAVAYEQQDAAGRPVAVAAALRGADLPFSSEEIQAAASTPAPDAAGSYPAGLQPPGLAASADGALLAVYTDVSGGDPAQSTTAFARRTVVR